MSTLKSFNNYISYFGDVQQDTDLEYSVYHRTLIRNYYVNAENYFVKIKETVTNTVYSHLIKGLFTKNLKMIQKLILIFIINFVLSNLYFVKL